MMAEQKKLYKDPDNKIIAGVCSGLAEYFDIDPTVVRILALALVLFTAIVPGLIFYVLAAIIMPEKESHGKEIE